jgi:hypothetical protein
MDALSHLELAVLTAIADQQTDQAESLRQQIGLAYLVGRRNTGAGFYATLGVRGAPPRVEIASPVGDVGADVDGVPDGMGFLLWLRDGLLGQLEGYTYTGSIEGRDLTALRYSNLGPRLR